MAFTGGTQTGGTIANAIVKIEVSTVTSGTSEKIEFTAKSMHSPKLVKESMTTPNANSEVGQQIGIKLMLDFVIIGTGAVADWTNINEIKDQDNAVAYIKVTYRDGQTETLDSSATGTDIAYFNATQTNDTDGVVEIQVHAERQMANIASTIS